MTDWVGCQSAREMLDRFVDGELSVAEQVVIQAHLRSCDTCAARVEDMQLIGASIRLGAASAPVMTPEDERALAVSESEVLTRVRAEHDLSLPVRLRQLFEDKRLVWPALGATAALALCLSTAVTVHNASRAADPQSIADMIHMLARRVPARALPTPLSAYYPVQLSAGIMAPRAISAGAALEMLSSSDEVFAVDAVVTRAGRVVNSELLQSRHADGKRTLENDEVDALLEAVKRSRFEPAQEAGGGAVTVRIVWLLAWTTVRA